MTAKTLDCGCMTWKPNCYSIPSMNEEKTVTFCTKHDPILNSVVNEASKDVSLSDLEHLYKKAKHLEEVKKNYQKEYGAVLSAQRAELERKKAEKDFIENIRIQVINYASKGETMKLVIPKTLSETTVDKFLREQKTLATDMFITVECTLWFRNVSPVWNRKNIQSPLLKMSKGKRRLGRPMRFPLK